MTIGFQIQPNDSASAESVTTAEVVKVIPAPVEAAAPNNTPNSAFYFLTVEFTPKEVKITEPGVAEHILRTLIHEHPLAVVSAGANSSQFMTPVKNDKWDVLRPIISKLEEDFFLNVVRFNVETMVPQMLQSAPPQQAGSGLLR